MINARARAHDSIRTKMSLS